MTVDDGSEWSALACPTCGRELGANPLAGGARVGRPRVPEHGAVSVVDPCA